MGRRVEQNEAATYENEAATYEQHEAMLKRRCRWLEIHLSTWRWTAYPCNVVPPETPLDLALTRARALPPGPARREAIEAAGREHLGDEVVDRLLDSGPGGRPDSAYALTQANLARAHQGAH